MILSHDENGIFIVDRLNCRISMMNALNGMLLYEFMSHYGVFNINKSYCDNYYYNYYDSNAVHNVSHNMNYIKNVMCTIYKKCDKWKNYIFIEQNIHSSNNGIIGIYDNKVFILPGISKEISLNIVT